MFNCCCAKRGYNRPIDQGKNKSNNQNNLEDIKRNSIPEDMPTKDTSYLDSGGLICFKNKSFSPFKSKHKCKRYSDSDSKAISDRNNNNNNNNNNNQADGPSITDSENLDSLGNLPFTEKGKHSFPYASGGVTESGANRISSNLSNLPPPSHTYPNHLSHTHNLSESSAAAAAAASCVATSRRGSLYICRHTDDLIVTPFAQILASLRNVRANFILITNVHSSREARFGSISTSSHTLKSDDNKNEKDENQKGLTIETLEELEWCLEQLESIQTHRSVSDMASSKFKRILNKELSQYADHTKSGNQISDYICKTFLDNEVNSNLDGQNDDDDSLSGVISAGVGGTSGDVGAIAAAKAGADTNSRGNYNRRVSGARLSGGTVSGTNVDEVDEDDTEGNYQRMELKSGGGKPQFRMTTSDADDVKSALTSQQRREATDQLDSIMYYGVCPVKYDEMNSLIEKSLDVWGLDIFLLAELSDRHPLTVISFAIFRKYNFFEKFSMQPKTFLNFITEIERKYHNDVPYHNSTHAADVTQSTNVLLGACPLENVFSDLELMSVIFACIVHDVDHPGVTNQYLINTNDQLALLYNDSSVLENHHLSVAFTALSVPENDISANMSKKQRQSFRKMIIDMVLATDMSKHMSLLADLKTMVETKKVAGSGILNLDNYNDRIQILQNMVHCADLSNPTKPLPLYRDWTGRIMSEFFSQGDKERQRNLEISPMCDRETATIEKSQVSFIDFIVHPLWETWSDLVYPEAQDILDTLEENREWYFNQIPVNTAASSSDNVDTSSQ